MQIYNAQLLVVDIAIATCTIEYLCILWGTDPGHLSIFVEVVGHNVTLAPWSHNLDLHRSLPLVRQAIYYENIMAFNKLEVVIYVFNELLITSQLITLILFKWLHLV